MMRSKTILVCSVTGPKFSVRPTKNATRLSVDTVEVPSYCTQAHTHTRIQNSYQNIIHMAVLLIAIIYRMDPRSRLCSPQVTRIVAHGVSRRGQL